MKLREKLKKKLRKLRQKLRPFRGLAWLSTLIIGASLYTLSSMTGDYFYTKLLMGLLNFYWLYSLLVSDARESQIWCGTWFIASLVFLVLLVVWF